MSQQHLNQWYAAILERVDNDLENFYLTFFPTFEDPKTHKKIPISLDRVGNSYRVNPCPFCGHNDCFTITPGVLTGHCFSCGAKGNHVQLLLRYRNNDEAMLHALGERYHIPYAPQVESAEDVYEQHLQVIRNVAAEFYHRQLMKSTKALEYQLNIRKRREGTLLDLKFGYSTNFKDLSKFLLEKGYSQEEMKDAKVWIPEGLLVYPYIDPFSKNVTRFNTKNPFDVTMKDKGTGEQTIVKGFSTHGKTMMTTPGLSYDYVVMVEGENDLATVYEQGCNSAIAIGGKLGEDQLKFLQLVLRKFKSIYCAFDNDAVGAEYTNAINDGFPHKHVFHVTFDNKYGDIDDYYKLERNPIPLDTLLKEAVPLTTDCFYVEHKRNLWEVSNRTKKLEFEILSKGKNNNLIGTIKYYENGRMKDMVYDSDLTKSKFKPMNFTLLDAMETYFNKDIDEKSLQELLEIYWFSKVKHLIIKRFAGMFVGYPDPEALITVIKTKLGDEVADIVLKEVNGLQNEMVENYAEIPKIKVSQFFSIKNDEAFFYFTYVRPDGDTIRKLPYLLANIKGERELIRLDLYKRKDPQCILLVQNKYELPFEVENAIMDLQDTSLGQNWVESYIKGEIDPRELRIELLVKRLEMFVRKFYYFEDENVFKVLALYIFATYCYEIFGEFPYLFINGKKGSGKTILDTVLALTCFNAKMAVSITEAALFRGISFEGGTYILDEMENLTSRQKSQESGMGQILKAGYTRSGRIHRCNMEKGNITESFDVYGPKIISNIFGIEDVIGDRCININTYEIPGEIRRRLRLEDPKVYQIEHLGMVRELTSKCCISVLENFKDIFKVFNSQNFDTDSARLSQILRPLLTIAHLAGPEYIQALNAFYKSNISINKMEIEYSTPEGALRDILAGIATEITDGSTLDPDKQLLSSNTHKYKIPINVSDDKTWFELDSLHIKTFMEEFLPDEDINIRNINIWVKRVAPIDYTLDRRRSTATIEEETLIQEFNGNQRVKVYVYRFKVADVLQGMTKERKETKAIEVPKAKVPDVKPTGKYSEF